ncbi:DUF4282 domain-containing protein [Kushneria aurantia]|uniref:DUF4282 domain-containing protein n=1 Tax=Kushneria aurantia TaxID=504092 RepID=A0ABV6G0M4_9GAMM|nr:DUF4282 domain-containing protein [Kushneria aurantia]
MQFSDLAGFNKFISPSLIKIAYWIGIILIVLMGLSSLFFSSPYSPLSGFFGFLIKLIGILLSLVFWRITCEAAILLFGMHERLGEIRDRLSNS